MTFLPRNADATIARFGWYAMRWELRTKIYYSYDNIQRYTSLLDEVVSLISFAVTEKQNCLEWPIVKADHVVDETRSPNLSTLEPEIKTMGQGTGLMWYKRVELIVQRIRGIEEQMRRHDARTPYNMEIKDSNDRNAISVTWQYIGLPIQHKLTATINHI